MKVCSKCFIEKDDENYFVKDKSKNRLHAQCKDCYRSHRVTNYAEHYLKYKQNYLERAKERRTRLRQEFRVSMLKYLENKSCTVCGEDDIRTLEFDHIDPSTKKFSISQAVRLGHKWSEVLEELKHCRILCANCHRKHTSRQAQWYKNI